MFISVPPEKPYWTDTEGNVVTERQILVEDVEFVLYCYIKNANPAVTGEHKSFFNSSSGVET